MFNFLLKNVGPHATAIYNLYTTGAKYEKKNE